MVHKSKLVSMIRLTIVGDVNGSARIENGENIWVVKASGKRGAVLDLGAGQKVSVLVFGRKPGEWPTLAPLNNGPEPAGSVIVKVFSGKVFKTPRGSLRSLRDSSPVLVTVVMTFRFSSPLTSTLGVEVLRLRLGTAETETAEAVRTTREAQREKENIIA